MFTSKATNFDNTDNSPFYIKDGVNYKYPLYKFVGTGLTSEVIQGTTYYKPSAGITTQTRPPKGIPENVTPPSASSFNIGNDTGLTSIEYGVVGVSSNFDYASITDGNNVTHARFLLTDGEAGGTFTESGASSGDSYKLFIEKTDTTLTDTIGTSQGTPNSPFAVFHHGTFANGGDPYSHGSVTAAASAGYFYSDTPTGTYELGTLDETPTFVQEIASEYGTGTTIRDGDGKGKTTYKFTFQALTSVDHLLVGGGGGGGGDIAGGGGAGGYLETKNTTISAGQKTIVVGGGGVGGVNNSYTNRGRNGADTSVTGLTTAIGGGGGATRYDTASWPAGNGGSGGGASGATNRGAAKGTGTSGQGFDGGDANGSTWYPAGGGGASAAGQNNPGKGGDGKQSTITGFTSYWFAGGGGGAGHSNSGGNGGKGGGGGGARHGSGSHGTGDTNGLTNGENGDDGTNQDSLEPPTDTSGGAGGKHTGGGGGGGDHNTNIWGGVGGSGIVIIRTGGNVTTGKKIAKVKDIVLDSENEESNVLISTQGTGISTVTYSIDGGSEVSTPVSQLSVAHGLNPNTTATLLAYGLDASNARLGVKLSKSITTVLGYETITLTDKNSSQTITYVGNGTTDVTNTYKSAGGNTWNGGWILLTGYTAPITFEYKASASNSDDGNSYKQIGISDSISQTYGSGNTDFDIYHYAYRKSGTDLAGADVTDQAESYAWNESDTFYIVYKSNGVVEWWQAGTKIKEWSWGNGKTVYLSTTFHKQGNGSDNGSFKNIRVKRRKWDGTKYIN
jgi:hypothetical protein